MAADRPWLLTAHIDLTALQALARAGRLPALLRGARDGPRAAGSAPAARRWRGGSPALPEASSGTRPSSGMVRTHVAAVLGHDDAGRDRRRTAPSRDLGFDSLAAIELRNRLTEATGLQLPATLVFDHPSPAAVARYLREQVSGRRGRGRRRGRRTAVDEPIAIVGMACRYPGGVALARGPVATWSPTARDAVTDFPADRGWDLERLYDPDPDHPGTTYARDGGFLRRRRRVRRRRSSGSARARRWRWTRSSGCCWRRSWEALERAGIDPAVAARQPHRRVRRRDVPRLRLRGALEHPHDGTEGYAMTGSAGSVVSGRVAYTLGLEGPAVTVDTACSSSLVALHLAVPGAARRRVLAGAGRRRRR